MSPRLKRARELARTHRESRGCKLAAAVVAFTENELAVATAEFTSQLAKLTAANARLHADLYGARQTESATP